jgi:hypothetical protein
MGSTKKNAEQDAARRALERLTAAEMKAGKLEGLPPEAGEDQREPTEQ